MKPFSFLFWLIFAGIVIYFGFRVFQSSQLPRTVDIAYYGPIKALSPAVCHFSSVSSSGGVEGDLYVLHGLTRFKYTVTSGQKSLAVAVIVNQEGTAFAWNEGASDGLYGDYEIIMSRLNLTSVGSVSCKPWWIPDPFLLLVPRDVKFQDMGRL